jgi:transposase
LNDQVAEIEREIKEVLEANPWLKKKIEQLCTIPGVGLITAATVVGETDGFDLIRTGKQLASYAGFDVVDKLSGTLVKGKPHISGKGNKHLQKAMYFPALVNIKYDKHHQNLYQ